ncbi:MAG: phosphoglycerate kinase [bacterium]
MQSIKQIKSLKGLRVLVRADFNVPLDSKGKVADMFRIKSAIPTIQYLQKKGAKIILLSHIGREQSDSLQPVYTALKKYIPLKFIPEIFGDQTISVVDEMKNGDVVMLENLRSNPGEKGCDKNFAKSLAKFGDVYVNEAFPVSHRNDASITALPTLLPSYAGIQFEKEVRELSRALTPKHPFVFIQGGAKAETKIPLLKKYLKTADCVFVGGELANDFFKAKGLEIGQSKTDSELPALKSILKDKKLLLPDTVVVLRGGKKQTISIDDIASEESIFDIGLPSIDKLSEILKKAKLVLWNGPMGFYEGGYTKGTEEILKLLANIKADTIIGGGDTAVLVDKKNMSEKFTFVSTGGGATLEFLAKGTLPGIKALK